MIGIYAYVIQNAGRVQIITARDGATVIVGPGLLLARYMVGAQMREFRDVLDRPININQ